MSPWSTGTGRSSGSQQPGFRLERWIAPGKEPRTRSGRAEAPGRAPRGAAPRDLPAIGGQGAPDPQARLSFSDVTSCWDFLVVVDACVLGRARAGRQVVTAMTKPAAYTS